MAIRNLSEPILGPAPRRPTPSPVVVVRNLLIGIFFTLATARYLVAPLDRFDEGVTLTKAAMAAEGRVPYRDFWNTYGALDIYMLAAAFRLITVNVMVARVLGALVMVLIGVVTYTLLRYLGLRQPIRFLMTGLITLAPLSLATFNTPFLTILLGLAGLLVFMISLDRQELRWPIAAGCLVGVIAFLQARVRHRVRRGLGDGLPRPRHPSLELAAEAAPRLRGRHGGDRVAALGDHDRAGRLPGNLVRPRHSCREPVCPRSTHPDRPGA